VARNIQEGSRSREVRFWFYVHPPDFEQHRWGLGSAFAFKSHTIAEGEEDQLRDFALSYSTALKAAAGSESEKELVEEDGPEPEEDAAAEDIIAGLSSWQDEHD
jgi:hypothetical protein